MSKTAARRESVTCGSQPSRSISGTKAPLTIQSLLTASDKDLSTLLGIKTKGTSCELSDLQLKYLRQENVDPAIPLTDLQHAQPLAEAAANLTALSLQIEEQQQRLQQLTDELAAHAIAQQQSDRDRAASSRVEKHDRQLESLQSQMTELSSLLRSQQPDSCTQGQTGLGHDRQTMLRLTGLQEPEDETEDDLAQRVEEILAVLPKDIHMTAAKRLGRPGGRRARAVAITFASVQDRSNVLRTKAALNKNEETKRISINVELSQEEQAHKNALWPTFMQAKHDQRRAFWRGCRLYVDGVLVPSPLQADPAWAHQYSAAAIPMPDQGYHSLPPS